MADNVTIPATGTGTATPVIASDDIGGIQHQRVKVSLGPNGTAADLDGDATGGAWVQGGVAHDAPDTGKPLKIGGKAVDVLDSFPPDVGPGDRVDILVGLKGQVFVSLMGQDGSADPTTLPVQGIAGGTPVVVVGKTVVVPATLTRPSDTTAYAAGDSVSSSTSAPTILTFSNVARSSGGSGTIVRALMTDSAYSATPGSFELWLLDTTMTPTNDNAAFAPSDANANALVAIIPFSAVYAGLATVGTGGNMVYQAAGPFPFVTVGSADLFGIVVVRNAYTPISAEAFQIRLFCAQD